MVKIVNTLSGKKEILKPLDLPRRQGGQARAKKLKLFVCGPTVYDYSHIGHARTYIFFDVFAKYLRQQGFDVFYLQNITDVDDKIVQRAHERNLPPRSFAKMFEKEYLKDMRQLGVNSVTRYARATDHIPEIVSQIKRLLKKGYAYEIEGDGIYFDISKFRGYGKLSGRTRQQAQDAVSRIDESVNKRNKGDFALWKLVPRSERSEDFAGFREPSWPSPWGYGRPGWHIEDTAITEKYFGLQYDIHGGARDLLFPHHEAEIAQMETLSGKKPMARYWVHTGFLTVQGEKMAKSLGNFIPVREFLGSPKPEGRKRISSRARLLRFLVLKAHYRSPLDYSEQMLEQAQSELERIDEFVDRLREKSKIPSLDSPSRRGGRNSKLALKEALQDDFNTPRAISILFDLIREGNILMDKRKWSEAQAEETLDFFKQIDEFFGFLFWSREKPTIPEEIKILAEQREQHRKHGNWQEADALRAAILARGWIVEDTPSGWKLKKLVYQE